MLTDLARNWWVLALRGVAGIGFAIAAFGWPDATLAALVLLFGAYVFVDGIFAVVAGIGMRQQLSRWWLLVLEGVAGIVLGVLTFWSPATTALVLLSWIAAWAIITGVVEIATAVQLRTVIENAWLLILSGVVSISFGILLIALPGPGALSLVWLLGAYALIFGSLTLVVALRLRGLRARLEVIRTGRRLVQAARVPTQRSPCGFPRVQPQRDLGSTRPRVDAGPHHPAPPGALEVLQTATLSVRRIRDPRR